MGSNLRFKGIYAFLLMLVTAMVVSASSARSQASSFPVTLQGATINPLASNSGKVTVLVFVRTDCPICNRYAPVIERLRAKYEQQGVEFFLVFPNPALNASAIRSYMTTYGYHCKALLDPGHFLVKRTGVQITPEAAVITASGNEIYHGRIDNWYVNFWTWRKTATVHDLSNAIQAALAGKADPEKTASAVGCYISDLQ